MMVTYWRLPDHPLQELRVGQWVEVNGDRLRVVKLILEPAKEDDPQLGVKAGDLVTTVEFSRPAPADPGPCPDCGWLVGDVKGHVAIAHPNPGLPHKPSRDGHPERSRDIAAG